MVQLDVWQDPSAADQPVDVMVGPNQRQDVTSFFSKIGLTAEDFVQDVNGYVNFWDSFLCFILVCRTQPLTCILCVCSMIADQKQQMEDTKRDNSFGWNSYYTLEEVSYIDS